MKSFIRESFKQNPEALQKLLATGNAKLTHTQDKTKWGKEFPKLLMEVRDELSTPESKKAIIPSGKTRLKDNNEYEIASINTELLNNLGYTPAKINEILKTICKLG